MLSFSIHRPDLLLGQPVEHPRRVGPRIVHVVGARLRRRATGHEPAVTQRAQRLPQPLRARVEAVVAPQPPAHRDATLPLARTSRSARSVTTSPATRSKQWVPAAAAGHTGPAARAAARLLAGSRVLDHGAVTNTARSGRPERRRHTAADGQDEPRRRIDSLSPGMRLYRGSFGCPSTSTTTYIDTLVDGNMRHDASRSRPIHRAAMRPASPLSRALHRGQVNRPHPDFDVRHVADINTLFRQFGEAIGADCRLARPAVIAEGAALSAAGGDVPGAAQLRWSVADETAEADGWSESHARTRRCGRRVEKAWHGWANSAPVPTTDGRQG